MLMKVFNCSDGNLKWRNHGLLCGVIGFIAVLYSTTQTWAAAPDLIVDRARLARTIAIETRTFNANDCAVIEHCISATGPRKLLRFAIGFCNIGQGDLVLGDPLERPTLYQYSPCHGHFHLKGTASYAILNSSGAVVRRGQKQAFCLLDSVKYLSTAGPSHGFSCNYQGLTRGWEDVYYRNLDCQWLDITGLRPGNYILWVRVNPARILVESNYANNTVTVPVTIR
jgi:Lysyl oxidase